MTIVSDEWWKNIPQTEEPELFDWWFDLSPAEKKDVMPELDRWWGTVD